MPSSGKYNLKTMGKGISANWSGDANVFANRPWHKSIDYTVDYIEVLPTTTTHTRGGAPSIFEIDKRGQSLGNVHLQFDRAHLASSGGVVTGTNYARFKDWEALASIDYIQVRYAEDIIYRIYGDELLLQQLIEGTTPEKQDVLATIEKGRLNKSDRLYLGGATAGEYQSTVTHIVDLQMPWASPTKLLHMMCLPQKVRVEIYWKSLSLCAYAEGASTVSGGAISNAKLICEFYFWRQVMQKQIWDMVNSKEGIVTKTIRNEAHRKELIVSGSTAFRLPLKNIRNDVFEFVCYIVPVAEVDTPSNTNDGEYWHSNFKLASITLQDSSQTVHPTIEYRNTESNNLVVTPSYGTYVLHGQSHPYMALNNNVMVYPLALPTLSERNRNDAMGYRGLQYYGNPELVFAMDALAADHYVYVYARIHDALIQVQGSFSPFLDL